MTSASKIDYLPLTKLVNIKQILDEYSHSTKLFKLGSLIGITTVLVSIIIALWLSSKDLFGVNGNDLFITFLLASGLFVVLQAIVRLISSARLRKFATYNNLEYKLDRYATGKYTNQLFNSRLVQIMSSLGFYNRIDGEIEIGNFRIVGARSFEQGYLSLSLPRRLPHMILSAKPYSFALPGDLAQNQHLSLEGDFDNYFKLYVPNGYERDALYVFTPDIMQLFKDNLSAFTIEIIDDRFYIYNGSKFRLTDPKLYARLFELLSAVMTKFDRQINFYTDDNIKLRTSNIIAPQGRILKYRSYWYSLSVLVVSIVALAVLFNVGSLVGTPLGSVIIANLFVAVGTSLALLVFAFIRRR